MSSSEQPSTTSIDPSSIQPTFFIGAERTGTTLFRLLLDSHPEITCLEGFRFVAEAMPSLAPGQDPATLGLPTIAEYEHFIETDHMFSSAGFELDTSLPDFVAVARSLLAQRMNAAGKKIVVAKLHRDFLPMLRIWPEARFIHLLRDPRDMAKSGLSKDWGLNAYVSAGKWEETELEWDRLCELVPEDRRIEIRFEDLARDHEAALAPVLDFLGVSYHPDMLSYIEPTDYTYPNPAKAEEWRTTMSDREVQLAEARVGDLLVDRGYEPSGQPALDITENEQKRIKVETTVKKWTHKLQFYGINGPLELVARKAGKHDIEKKFKQEMNRRERAARVRSWRVEGREYSYSPAKKAELGLDPDAP